MAKTSGAQLVADTLQGYGVTHVFFVPQILMRTLAAMEPMGIRRMMVHGEKAAAYMADGYARASRRPGVCMAQHVGSSNLAAGLRDAYLACSPVIAITGGPTPEARYRHAYQEIESFSQFEPTTKLNLQVGEQTEKAREMWGFNEVDFSKIAESFGCVRMRVEQPADMPRALERALAAGRPVVIDAVTDHLAFAPRAWTGESAGGGH